MNQGVKSNGTGRIVVIGAGMGGLASAMRLAHGGAEVVLVEAAEAPGGKMRTVPSAAGPVDAGPTVLTMRWVFDALFSDVGARLEDHVTLAREPVLARHWWPDGSRLDLFDDPAESARAVEGFAGARARRQFEAFRAAARRLFEGFDAPMMQAADPSQATLAAHVARHPGLIPLMGGLKTMAADLARSFADPRLRQLFGRYATYVGGSPYETPALLRLIWHAEALGVWHVAGGMHGLARAMAAVAKDLGVAFRYAAPVRRIEVQAGRVAAVHLAGGDRIDCADVVFNGDPRALAEGMLGEGVRGAVTGPQVEPRSLSANVWSFAARVSGPDLAHHNVFFGADPRTEFGPIAGGHLPQDPTLYICAQDRGAAAPAGASDPDRLERFEIIMNAPPLPGALPEDISACRTRTFPVLKAHGLRFSPEPEDRALTTPSGFEGLFPGSQGSLYGRSPHGMMAAFARPRARSGLPGLYLAGGGAHPGAGIAMATLSGTHAAGAILTDRTFTSKSRPTAMPGGMSTGSAMTAAAPSRSSPS